MQKGPLFQVAPVFAGAFGAPAPDLTTLPAELDRLLRGLFGEWQPLAWSLLGAVVAITVGRVAGGLTVRAMGRWARHTDTIIDDAIAKHLARPIRWLFPVLALTSVVSLLPLPKELRGPLHHAVLIATIFGVGWALIKCVRVAEEVVQHRYDLGVADNLKARTLQTQFRSFGNIAIFAVGLVTIAFVLTTFDSVRQLGTGLLASAGVAGIVLGFAAQKTIATVLAGLQIAISQPIRIDDVVIVENEWGRIEEIALTYVVVRIWDLRRLVVPIGYFIEKPFQNWTRASADILGTVNLHLDYSVPVDRLRAELKRLLDGSEKWDKKTWGLQVTDSSERTMTLRALMSAANASDAWDLRCEIREKLIAFVQEGYPGALPRLRGELKSA